MGACYLICLASQVSHARHYLGYAEHDVDARVSEHVNGRREGSALVARAGGGELVRTWPGATRSEERRLKRRKNARGLCPRCKPGYNADCAENMRRVRQRRRDRARRMAAWTGAKT